MPIQFAYLRHRPQSAQPVKRVQQSRGGGAGPPFFHPVQRLPAYAKAAGEFGTGYAPFLSLTCNPFPQPPGGQIPFFVSRHLRFLVPVRRVPGRVNKTASKRDCPACSPGREKLSPAGLGLWYSAGSPAQRPDSHFC